uniref:Alternative protein LMTK2 n=1 Tax=Homo sapiens TaxID=9606 RepID=L8E8L1_HUMAN|nr:alternative protein LMTK2 [Homo sapiens]
MQNLAAAMTSRHRTIAPAPSLPRGPTRTNSLPTPILRWTSPCPATPRARS